MILAAAAMSPLRAFALCVAADGHWSLEPAHATPACDMHWAQHHDTERGLETADADAHPCVDVAAIGATACADRDVACDAVAGVGVVLPVPPGGGPRAGAPGPGVAWRPPPSAALLRTVVLQA